MTDAERIEKLRGAIHAMRLVALETAQGQFTAQEGLGTIATLGAAALDEDAQIEQARLDAPLLPLRGITLSDGKRQVRFGYKLRDSWHAVCFLNAEGDETAFWLSDEAMRALIQLYGKCAAAAGEGLIVAGFLHEGVKLFERTGWRQATDEPKS